MVASSLWRTERLHYARDVAVPCRLARPSWECALAWLHAIGERATCVCRHGVPQVSGRTYQVATAWQLLIFRKLGTLAHVDTVYYDGLNLICQTLLLHTVMRGCKTQRGVKKRGNYRQTLKRIAS